MLPAVLFPSTELAGSFLFAVHHIISIQSIKCCPDILSGSCPSTCQAIHCIWEEGFIPHLENVPDTGLALVKTFNMLFQVYFQFLKPIYSHIKAMFLKLFILWKCPTCLPKIPQEWRVVCHYKIVGCTDLSLTNMAEVAIAPGVVLVKPQRCAIVSFFELVNEQFCLKSFTMAFGP